MWSFKFKCRYFVSAIVGIAGLKPTFESIGNAKAVLAIANKESVISAGTYLKSKIKEN